MGIDNLKPGPCDEAIKQWEAAVKKSWRPFEVLSMLGFCHRERGMRDQSQQSSEKALRIEGIAQEKVLDVKYMLSLLYLEQGRIEEALKSVQEIAAVDERFRNLRDEIVELTDYSGPRADIIQGVKQTPGRGVDGLE
jgi:tetratricopeptide (TPR) repeat protein